MFCLGNKREILYSTCIGVPYQIMSKIYIYIFQTKDIKKEIIMGKFVERSWDCKSIMMYFHLKGNLFNVKYTGVVSQLSPGPQKAHDKSV